jgi:flagellar biosynthesis/type III secretory pathway protein FliH
MKKTKIFLSFLLVTFMCSFSAHAESVKNVSQHITVDKRALLVLEDGSIYELLPIKPRSKSFFEYLCFSEAPTIEENLIVDLKDFPLPSFVGITNKPKLPEEIMKNLDNDSKENISNATHYIHIEKDGYDKYIFAKCFDLVSLLQDITMRFNKKADDAYEDGHSKGYYKGYDDGHYKGKNESNDIEYTKGYKYGYKLGYKDALNQSTTYSADKKKGDSEYTYGYNIGYDYGLTDGKKKGESTGYNKGYDYGYKLGCKDTKKDSLPNNMSNNNRNN